MVTIRMLSLISFICLMLVKRIENFDINHIHPEHMCLKTKYHLESPLSINIASTSHCQPWMNLSCCSKETVDKIDRDIIKSLHNMDLEHCPGKVLSEQCKNYFKKDTCLYECSTNLAPWIAHVGGKDRKERYVNIPLCEIDCFQWFQACSEDFTCSRSLYGAQSNFSRGSHGNRCLGECSKFKNLFNDHIDFCQTFFPGSFKIPTDNEPCINLWPVGNIMHKNHLVSVYYSNKLNMPTKFTILMSIIIPIVVVTIIIIIGILIKMKFYKHKTPFKSFSSSSSKDALDSKL